MEIIFLGTGAPEGNPSPFCDCENCQYVRVKKGKNIRLQSSLLVDDKVLIDFGPDVTRSFNNLGLSMSQLKYVLITHCHHDHFYAGNLFNRLVGPRKTPISDLHIYGPRRINKLANGWLMNPKEQQVFLHSLKPFTEIPLGQYSVKTFAITQNDEFSGKGMCFAISSNKKSLLYAVDTYLMPEENWENMLGLKFDLVILDETFGEVEPPNKDHHNIRLFEETLQRMKKEKLVTEKTKFFAQHMSHHNPPHDKLADIMKKKNVQVPYDGLKIKL